MTGAQRLVGELAVLGLIVLSLPLVLMAGVFFLIPGLILWLGARLTRTRRPVPRSLSPGARRDMSA